MSLDSLDPAWAKLVQEGYAAVTTDTTPDSKPRIVELAEIVSRAAQHFVQVGPAVVLDAAILLLDSSKGGRGMRIFVKAADAAGELHSLMLSGNTKYIDLKLREYRSAKDDTFKFDNSAELTEDYLFYLARKANKLKRNGNNAPDINPSWSSAVLAEVKARWQPAAATPIIAPPTSTVLPWQTAPAAPVVAGEWSEGW
ncbi:hypothetical protein [Azospirillum sp. Sh1]|uniref:hypothetical protein n=1 Tax=Azospirillum sp. Sh1 TaxID=2607285 RepID=UPI0011ED7162|nr:hypothetical protein [Azospirillum sp. Sh1]KAA0573400.1 hypothetical protein FZ029_20700 [Azospirillum sp. Sh1]